MRALLTASTLLALLALASCEADIPEGRFSCVDDAGCPAGWFCHPDRLCYSAEPDAENNAATCSNGVDDDQRGGADCLDASCVDAGYCLAHEAEPGCDPWAQTGCPIGMACYQKFRANATWGTECRLPGQALPGDVCDLAELTPSGRHPCTSGQGCFNLAGQRGTCGDYCQVDSDCPDGALCEGETTERPGLCPAPCNPNQPYACASGYACASYALLDGWRFVDGGARHICVVAGDLRDATAQAGDPCVDPPGGATPPAQVCGPGSVCVPETGGAFCRPICELHAVTPCGAGAICRRPTDPAYVHRPLVSGFGEELGTCR